MTVYEHDDQGLRVIGYNHGVYLYNPDRSLACELYLKPDGTLASNCAIAGGVGGAPAPAEYVRLDGNNWASWLPTGGTQSVVGSFNLQGAAFQYKITGRHSLSMPGTANLLAGDGAGAALTTGTDNVLMGYQVGATLTNNAENVIIGSSAGAASGYLDDVVLIGFAAMSEADSVGGYNSVVIGDNSGGAAEIMDSVVIGSTALRDATAVAYSSADVIIGGGAVIGGVNPYKGDYNVIIGTRAAPALGDADSDVLIGYGVARAATTASRNVVIGTEAGEDMLDAWVNVVLGWRTGYQLTNGDYNTIVGARAGGALTTGSSNTIVGYQAGNALATAAGGVYLGYQAGYYETGSNKLFIDNAQRASEADARVKALVYGVFDAATANQHLTFNSHLHYGGGPGYALHQSYSAVDNTGVTVIADATGDVTATVTFLYAVYAITGTDSTGGTVTLEPGDSFVLYNDGTDVLTMAVSAGGAVTVARTAGADTFNVALQGVWL